MKKQSPVPGKYLGALALAAAFVAGSVQAATIPFEVFEGFAGDFEGTLEYNLSGNSFVTTIRNNSSNGNPHIKDIYFETPTGTLFQYSPPDTPTWTDVPGISFSLTPNPGPQGNPPGSGLTDPWIGTDFWFAANPAPPKEGLSPGESITINWTLMDNLDPLGFRVAVHVGDCLGSESCTAITGLGLDGGVPPEALVPIPAAAWLFGSALLGLVGVARRKQA